MTDLRPTPSTIRFAKWLVILNGAIPATLLFVDALRGQLGANPVNFAIRSTGYLGLIFLILSLAITPAARLSGQGWLVHFRRSLGLYAFFHALAHFAIFFVWDREANVGGTLSELRLRPYLLVGTVGLLLMAPLAVTSTNGMIARLGPKNWKRLHRLAYPAAIAGVVHFAMLQKVDLRLPTIYAAILGALLAYRLIAHFLKPRARTKLAPASVPPASVPPASTRAARPAFWRGQLRVAATFDETPDVRTFRLAPVDGGPLPFDYRSGQYMTLALTVDGRAVNRSYTIASAPTRAGACELTVKREAMGTSSTHLHRAVRVGDLIRVGAPAGQFTFDEATSDGLVMIAGGVGVTPLMSKLRYLTDVSWPGNVHLIFSARTEADVIFRDELAYLARRHPNVRVTVTLTRAGDDWAGERGRVTGELLARVEPDLARRHVHVCGPTAMADATRDLLLSLGVPAARIATESFTSPKAAGPASAVPPPAVVASPPPIVANGRAHALTFARSGRTVDVPADQTVLEAAEAHGVDIDYDCRSGICGTCKVRLVSGTVSGDIDDALTAADRAKNVILACQSRCTADATIDA